SVLIDFNATLFFCLHLINIEQTKNPESNQVYNSRKHEGSRLAAFFLCTLKKYFAKLPHQHHKPKSTMHISWNEIKARALRFSKEWENESREHAEAKTFWDEFFHIFDISRPKLASFEEPVKKLNDQYGF